MGDLHLFSSPHNTKIQIKAVIFDLDGTLLNTEQATKNILREFLARYGKEPDVEKEERRLGMTQKESVIATIRDYDLPLTPEQFTQEIFPLFEGMWLKATALPGSNRLMEHLHKNGVPFALASNSLRKNIEVKLSHQQGWKEYFSVILGSDNVKAGKPAPDMFLEAANRMGFDAVDCLVIEDSLVGVKAAKAAGMNVVAVPSFLFELDQHSIADSVLHSLLDFLPELWGLPPFEDWVCNALPIEPIYLRGKYSNGLLQEFSDDESSLPDQVQGLYFGLAKVDEHEIFKIAISIGWENDCCKSRRKFKVCVLDGTGEQICDKEMQLVIVGYVRGPSYMGNKFNILEILEDDKLIATAALNLPEYLHETSISFFQEVAVKDDDAALE